MSRNYLCYATCLLATQTVALTLPVFHGIKRCVQYLASHAHKPIFYLSNSYEGSNFIRLTWSGNKVEDHTTHNFFKCHQDADHAKILNKIRSVSGIIHTLLGVSVWWKVNIQPAIAYDSTGGEIRCVYKSVKKNKFIQRYMEALAFHTSAPTVHWEYNPSWISIVKVKRVIPRVKHIAIPVCLYKKMTILFLFQI